MIDTLFLRQWARASGSTTSTVSDESGLATTAPVSADANTGSLSLSAGGVPLAATSLDLALQRGGYATGTSTPSSGYRSSALRWRLNGETASQWRGYTDRLMLTYQQRVSTDDQPFCSPARSLANGQVGFLAIRTTPAAVRFLYKANRTDNWNVVVVSSTDVNNAYSPDFVVMPNGRLIAYWYSDAYAAPVAWTSTDHGVSWSEWSVETGLGFEANARLISAMTVGDAICVATSGSHLSTGNGRIYWSLDGGQSFVLADSAVAMLTARVLTTAVGTPLIVYVDAAGVGNAKVLIVGGGVVGGARALGISCNVTNPSIAACVADDGSLWAAGGLLYPIPSITLAVSLDHGCSWLPPGGAVSGLQTPFYNQTSGGTSRGFKTLNLGEWGGELVFTCVTASQTAAADDSLYALHLGGWDSATDALIQVSAWPKKATPYGANTSIAFASQDLPDNQGWTRADTGAGATVTIGVAGINIVATGAVNSRYTPPAAGFNPAAGNALRIRAQVRYNSGEGTPTDDRARIQLAIGDGANRQWIQVRFGTDAIRLRDNSGNLVTSAVVANQFTNLFELFIAFAHDYPAAGGGRATVRYRINGATHWVTLADSVAIAEEAGTATQVFNFGGVTAAACNWDITGIASAEGAGGHVDSWVNPTSLAGRELSSAFPFRTTNGVRIGGQGGIGIAADTYTFATSAHFAGSNVWLAPRPSCQWRTPYNKQQTLVLGDGDKIPVDTVMVVGTNWQTGKVEFNNTNTWGAPAASVAVSSVVWQGVATASEVGVLVVDGSPFVPHEYRSSASRRWFVAIGAVPGTVFEIVDNTASMLQVAGIAATFGGGALRVFGDRMGAVLPSPIRYGYARLKIDVQNVCTADANLYRTGSVLLGERHDMQIPYDNGFVDRWLPRSEVYESDAGYRTSALVGPERREIRVAWGLIDRLSTSYMRRLVEFLRATEGEHRVIGLWRDPSNPRGISLVRVLGPPSTENVYGENYDELARVPQLVMTEEI